MGDWIELKASDGHRVEAYRALPTTTARGGLVIVQEIFGVNRHIRNVCDGFADEGYAVLAPSLFDREQRRVELDYTGEGTQRGRALRGKLGWDPPLLDVDASVRALEEHRAIGVVGYCWGGSVAWLSACRLGVACAVSYYGGQIAQLLNEKPRAPVLLHFGDRDPLIPRDDVNAIQLSHPAAIVHVYAAGHGFNCDERADYDKESAALARERTLAFLGKHVG